jgi:hypothetical protein
VFDKTLDGKRVCPACHLHLQIDRKRSEQALEALRKVQLAKDKLLNKEKI